MYSQATLIFSFQKETHIKIIALCCTAHLRQRLHVNTLHVSVCPTSTLPTQWRHTCGSHGCGYVTSSAESPIISHIKVCSFLFESVGGYEALMRPYTEAVDEETCPTVSRFTVRWSEAKNILLLLNHVLSWRIFVMHHQSTGKKLHCPRKSLHFPFRYRIKHFILSHNSDFFLAILTYFSQNCMIMQLATVSYQVRIAGYKFSNFKKQSELWDINFSCNSDIFIAILTFFLAILTFLSQLWV